MRTHFLICKKTLAALAIMPALFAQSKLDYYPAEGLRVNAVTDGKNAITTNGIVTVHSPTEVTLVWQASELNGPPNVPPISAPSMAAPVKCPAGDYVNVTIPVSVSAQNKPGTYDGTVEFREAKVAPSKSIKIPIMVQVKGKPVVTVGPAGLTAYHCVFPWSCSLGAFLDHPTQSIPLNNKDGQEVAHVTGVDIMLRCKTGDKTLLTADLKPTSTPPSSKGRGNLPDATLPRGCNSPLDLILPIGCGSTLDVTVSANAAISGHYDGYVLVTLDNGDSVSQPLTLDVRDGPWIAILLLAIGIVFGRVLQKVNSPTALAQQRLTSNLGILRSSANDITNPEVSLLLAKKIADARAASATMSAGEAAITDQLQKIGTAITIESNLEWIEANLNRIPAAAQPAVQADVESSRNALLGDNLPDAEQSRQKAQGNLLQHMSAAGVLPKTVQPAAMQFDAIPPHPPQQRVHVRVASYLAGTPPHIPAGEHAFIRALMFVVLLVGLVVVGLYSLYIKNPTFGASMLFDYFGVAVWGLSADVAQRTLQGLQLPKS